MNNSLRDIALQYLDHGFSVIPIGSDKKPLISWKEYQKRHPTEEEVRSWFSRIDVTGIGIVTGKISGIAVLDIDKGAQTDGLILPPTPTTKTGGDGWHYYYKCSSEFTLSCHNGFRHKMDFKAEGGYVIAPPSLHKSGKRYEWAIPFEQEDLAEIPEWLLTEVLMKERFNKPISEIIHGVPVGERNESATVIAGKYLATFKQKEWEDIAWPAFVGWNKQNSSPMDQQELRTVWESIKKRQESKKDEHSGGGKKSQSDLLIEIIEDGQRNIVFFHDENTNAYVNFPAGNHRETWPCKSKTFKNWLIQIFWSTHHKSPNSESITSAINFAESKARFEGDQIKLSIRVAWHNDTLWYDLADPEWRAIKITSDDWEIIASPPIIFKRYSHQQPQIVPIKDESDMNEFLQFVNVTDQNQQILLIVLLIASFIPDFPHPAPLIYGPQGSAKSMLLRLMRKLVDPSSMETSGIPLNQNELAQLLQHHWCVFFDNITDLPKWLSDMLCRAISGDGFSKRELYSDDDDVIYSFRRCIAINGITPMVTKPDLLERSIVFELERVSEDKREQERVLIEQFEKKRPYLLGSIFNALSHAIKIYPSIRLDSLPRMADFTVWGCAIAESVGYGMDRFVKAYQDNLNHQNTEVIEENLVSHVLMTFMEQKNEWEGRPSELLKELTTEAGNQNINTAQEKEWPKAANVLTKTLKQLETNLVAAGIRIIRGRNRLITIQKLSQKTVPTVPASQMPYVLQSQGDAFQSQPHQPSLQENTSYESAGDG